MCPNLTMEKRIIVGFLLLLAKNMQQWIFQLFSSSMHIWAYTIKSMFYWHSWLTNITLQLWKTSCTSCGHSLRRRFFSFFKKLVIVFFSIKDMLGTSKKLLTREGEKETNFTPKIKEDNRFLFHFLNGICFIPITSSISLPSILSTKCTLGSFFAISSGSYFLLS